MIMMIVLISAELRKATFLNHMKKAFKVLDCQERDRSEDSVIFDTAWSPSSCSLIAASSILGTVSLYDLNRSTSSASKSPTLLDPVFRIQSHTESCRSIDFTVDGTGLFVLVELMLLASLI